MPQSADPITRLREPFSTFLQAQAVGSIFPMTDRLVGRRFRHARDLSPLNGKRILILKPCCLGDVIFSTAFVRELRRQLPAASITYAVSRHARPAIASNPHLNALIEVSLADLSLRSPVKFFRLAMLLRNRRFDVAFVLERSAVATFLPLVAGVPQRFGLNSGGRGFTLSAVAPVLRGQHETLTYLTVLEAAGGEFQASDLEFYPSPLARSKAREIALSLGVASRPLVLIHPGGGINPGMALTRKRWPVPFAGELALRAARAGAAVALVGAAEDQVGAAAALAIAGVKVRNLAGQLDLDTLGALAQWASVYVGNDSGPTHLAEAAGAPVVMLFGPSDPATYGPFRPDSVALSADVPCSPCFVGGRFPPCANIICMPGISVERVWSAVKPFIDRPALRQPDAQYFTSTG